jgi:acyl-CoA thioesterase FadM
MNLIFRMLRLLLLRKRLDALTPLEMSHLQTRVWPLDCDFNFHLTNSRYPSLLDLARTQYLLQINAFSMFVGGGWKSVLSSQSISFIKEIKPFTAVDITTQVLYWDRKYCYIEHQFLVAGKLHAKALAQVAFIKGRRVRAYDKLLAELGEGYQTQSPEMTDQLATWSSSLKNIKT